MLLNILGFVGKYLLLNLELFCLNLNGFAVEDLPLAELQPRFLHLQWRTSPLAEHSDNDDEYGIN